MALDPLTSGARPKLLHVRIIRRGAHPGLGIRVFDHPVKEQEVLSLIPRDLPVWKSVEEVVRLRYRITKIEQQSSSIVARVYIHGIYAKTLDALQIRLHFNYILCFECNIRSDQVFDSRAQRFPLRDWLFVFIGGSIPFCDAEFPIQLILHCCREGHITVATDCQFAIELGVNKLAVRSTFVIERIHVRVEQIHGHVLLVFGC